MSALDGAARQMREQRRWSRLRLLTWLSWPLAVDGILTGCGAALRRLAVPGPGAVMAAAAGLVIAAMVIPRLWRRLAGCREPAKAKELTVSRAWTPGSVLPGPLGPDTLAAARAFVARALLGGWRSAHLHVLPPGRTGRHAAIRLAGARLRVMLSQDVALDEPDLAVACLDHEMAKVRGWRYQLGLVTGWARFDGWALGGWAIIGWAVHWPYVLAAMGVLRVATTLLAWLIEMSCDWHVAVRHGHEVVQELLRMQHFRSPCPVGCLCLASWRWRAVVILTALSGRLAAPIALREALLGSWPGPTRVLRRHS